MPTTEQWMALVKSHSLIRRALLRPVLLPDARWWCAHARSAVDLAGADDGAFPAGLCGGTAMGASWRGFDSNASDMDGRHITLSMDRGSFLRIFDAKSILSYEFIFVLWYEYFRAYLELVDLQDTPC
ncbi:MAG: hypothetical protein AAGD34_08685 [Pseudomonadota bacterium]